jgi:hypothetical protein
MRIFGTSKRNSFDKEKEVLLLSLSLRKVNKDPNYPGRALIIRKDLHFLVTQSNMYNIALSSR